MLKYLWILCVVSHSCLTQWDYDEEESTLDKPAAKQCPYQAQCKGKYKKANLSEEEVYWILRFHNFYRNEIALGNDETGGNSRAANMKAMGFNKELQQIAQCQAHKCTGVKLPKYCKNTNLTNLGRNIFSDVSDQTIDIKNYIWILNPLQTWFDEIENMNKSLIDKYEKSKKKIRNVSQMLWANSSEIGCGRTWSVSTKESCLYFHCFYRGRGNILGQPIYKRGTPCSDCGEAKCNSEFHGLCGEIQMRYDIQKKGSSTPPDYDQFKSKTTSLYNYTLQNLVCKLIILLSICQGL